MNTFQICASKDRQILYRVSRSAVWLHRCERAVTYVQKNDSREKKKKTSQMLGVAERHDGTGFKVIFEVKPVPNS